MKNHLSLLVVLGFVCSASSQAMHYCLQDDQFESDQPYFFALEFTALFLKPGTSNAHYAAEAVPLPLPSPHWNIFDVHPNYHFGFDLGCIIASREYDNCCIMHWQHFKSCDTAAAAVGSDNMVGPFFEIGPDATPYSNAFGKVSFTFNEASIAIGYDVAGERFQATVFGGVGVTHLQECRNFTYVNPAGTIVRTIITPTRFLGAGPQLGAYISYDLTKRLFINAKGICTLLTGTANDHTTYYALSPALEDVGVTPPNTQTTCVCNRTLVVPALQEKIGIAYAFVCNDRYFAQFEAGYQAQIYISMLQSVDIGSEVITPPVIPDTVGVFARTFQRTISNFSLTGPYLMIEARF